MFLGVAVLPLGFRKCALVSCMEVKLFHVSKFSL